MAAVAQTTLCRIQPELTRSSTDAEPRKRDEPDPESPSQLHAPFPCCSCCYSPSWLWCRRSSQPLSLTPLRLPVRRQKLQRRQVSALGARASAKLPAGVEAPKDQPKLPTPFWGFTENAEVWNSRAAMIGFFALLLLEYVSGQGILELMGLEVGKGLDLPI